MSTGMKLSKEVWLVVAAIGFLLSYLIDRLAGPVVISVGSPVSFLTSSTLLNLYPFTAAAIIIRSISLLITSLLIVSFFERQYFTKAIFLVFIGILAEFYAIQQLANGFKMTSIQWTLSIAYGSVLLLFGVVGLTVRGIWAIFNPPANTEAMSGQNSESILNP